MTSDEVKKAINDLSHLLKMDNYRINMLPEALNVLAWANVAHLETEEVEALRQFARDAAREFQEACYRPKNNG